MDLSFPINKLTTHISGLPTMAIPKFISTHKIFSLIYTESKLYNTVLALIN